MGNFVLYRFFFFFKLSSHLLCLLLRSGGRHGGRVLVQPAGGGLVLLGHPPGVHVVPAALGGHLLGDDGVDALLEHRVVLPVCGEWRRAGFIGSDLQVSEIFPINLKIHCCTTQ